MAEKLDPQEKARPFTPYLSDLVDDPLYSKVWNRKQLSARDRSLITIAALVVLSHPDELEPHLRLGLQNGLTKSEISEAITHLAFYGGFPSALSAGSLAAEILGPL